MNNVAQSDAPYGRLDSRADAPYGRLDSRADAPYGRLDSKAKDPHSWVVLTARRAGSEEMVTVEMTYDQWLELPPVQYVVKTLLSRQQPRRPTAPTNAVAAPVPRGHIEWKQGQNWVALTAHAVGSRDTVTVEIALGQWFCLIPVEAAVADRLERWESNKMRQTGEWEFGAI